MQLDEFERVESVLDRARRFDEASLIGLGVNAPKELPRLEDQFWATVNEPLVPTETRLEQATAMLQDLAYIERVARRQRRRRQLH